MKTLIQIWEDLRKVGYETDKGSIHSYLPVYEKLLAPYRETALNVLEIGLFNGNSIRMWAEYFTKAKVWGIDCSLTPHDGMADLNPLVNDIMNSQPYQPLFNTHVHIFDAENKEEVAKRFTGTKFDVIIEDAGHEINQQLNLFDIWKEYIADGGIYIIEDVQDLDKDEHLFYRTRINRHLRIIDLRNEKGRYDDVLIVIKPV